MMAITFAKATLAALEALLKRVLAEVMDPIQKQLGALSGSAPPTTPPVTQPTPDPVPEPTTPPQANSGCVIAITSASGEVWRWDASAAAKQDSLGLRAMTEVPSAFVGVTSLRLVVDLGAGWAVLAPRNDIAMREGAGEARYSLQVTLDGREVLNKRYLVQSLYTGEIYTLGQEPFWPLPTTADLHSRGLVAPYVQGSVAAEKVASWAAAMASPDWDAQGSSRGVTQYMPMTGGREDIGPTTAAQAGYLISRSQVALGLFGGPG